jgi:hypothetical protein
MVGVGGGCVKVACLALGGVSAAHCSCDWAQRKCVPVICSQEVSACFALAHHTSHMPASCCLSGSKWIEIIATNWTCDWLCYCNWEVKDSCSCSPGLAAVALQDMFTRM